MKDLSNIDFGPYVYPKDLTIIKEEKVMITDHPDWDWGKGYCRLHLGQDLPCKECQKKYEEVIRNTVTFQDWFDFPVIEYYFNFLQYGNTFDGIF